MTQDNHRASIQKWMLAFLEPNQIVEIRLLEPVKTRTFQGSQFDDMIDYIIASNGNHKGVYFTPNPLAQVAGTGANGNHKDVDVLRRNWILIDIDTERGGKNISSTDSELEASKKVADSIYDTLKTLKFGGMIYGTSGNGHHVCVPVNLPNTEQSTQKHKQILYALDERFSTDAAKVDRSTFNASRIWKIPGTLAKKGEHTADRPHRHARLIEVPTNPRSYADNNTKLLDTLISNWTPRVAQVFDDDRHAIVRRAMKYLEKEPPAVEGEHGSDRCYHVAGICHDGFALSIEESLAAMQSWNLRCQPPWSEKELRHKVASVKSKMGPRGHMLERLPPMSTSGPIDNGTPIIVRANSITTKVVKWLWPDRIPLGKLTTFAGVGGLGKTFCLLDIAARVSRGSEWPHTNGECAERGQTLFISGEDDPDDTLVPRLEGMDADLSQIVFLRSDVADQFTLKDLETLEKALEQSGSGVKFVAIDPPTCFLGGADDHKNSELRALLSPLKSFAAKHNVSIIFNTHLNKGTGSTDAMMRVMGSVAWVNAVRAAHLFARDPDESEKRIFACMKNNLGPETKALTYKIAVEDGRPRIVWLDEVDTTADDAVNKKTTKSKTRKESASEWLTEQFRDRREWPSAELKQLSIDFGLSKNAIYEARELMPEIKAKKVTTGAGDTHWVWYAVDGWPPPPDDGESF